VSKQLIEAIFAQHIKTGQAARLDQIDRALLLTDDLPGVTVAGALEAGQRDGETALLLKSSDEAAYYGDVAVDNTGSRSTGSQRLSAGVAVRAGLLGAVGVQAQGMVGDHKTLGLRHGLLA
jgi:hemolysin activation/secretion protein